jgi:hypothetical protein
LIWRASSDSRARPRAAGCRRGSPGGVAELVGSTLEVQCGGFDPLGNDEDVARVQVGKKIGCRVVGEEKAIGSGASHQQVLARPAVEYVVAGAPRERVGAFAALEVVVAFAAVEVVLAVFARQPVGPPPCVVAAARRAMRRRSRRRERVGAIVAASASMPPP